MVPSLAMFYGLEYMKMYNLVHTVEDDDYTVSYRQVLHRSSSKLTLSQLQTLLDYNGLDSRDKEALRACLDGNCVLIDCRDNCIQLIEVDEDV